ncbi:MAG: hypothetical protein HYU66_05090 [Armatimonadetes bacterium]|nr:hypothetical protein [Armatimonadota bacterium]
MADEGESFPSWAQLARLRQAHRYRAVCVALLAVTAAAYLLPALYGYLRWVEAVRALAAVAFGLGWLSARFTRAMRRAPHWRAVVTGTGLVVHDAGGGVLSLSWSDITAVEVHRATITVHHAGGSLAIPPDLPNGLLLARRIAAHLQHDHDAATDGGMPAEEVAELLEPGWRGYLEHSCTAAEVTSGTGLGMLALGGIVLSAGLAAAADHLPFVVAFAAAFCMTGLAWLYEAVTHPGPRRFRVDGASLVAEYTGRRVVVSWPELVEVQRVPLGWLLRTAHGDIPVYHGAGAAAFVERLERVLQVRAERGGRVRLTTADDRSISRVRDGEERAERGISRSGRED